MSRRTYVSPNYVDLAIPAIQGAIDLSTRYQALPGNADPEALPPIFAIASEDNREFVKLKNS